MKDQDSKLPSGLYIIATPIGNMGDISYRAVQTLGKIDVLACEDTRETGKLTTAYGLDLKKIPYHEHNAAEMRPKIVQMIKDGKSVGLVSDAGMPLVSDPGYKLVQSCQDEGLYVTCVPGASASLAALVLSGLPPDRFMFAGFLPAKSAARQTALEELRHIPATLIFYETANRLIECLQDMRQVLGKRPAAVVRELTKKFEEVRRETLEELAIHYQADGAPKGEIVIVVGAPGKEEALLSSQDIDRLLSEMIRDKKMSIKDAVAEIVDQTGLRKKDIYQQALRLSKSDE